jgi:hypothetical protein
LRGGTTVTATTPESERIRVLDREEARALFDREVRRTLGIPGKEFIRAWKAGEYDDDPDRSDVMYLAMLLPFAE